MAALAALSFSAAAAAGECQLQELGVLPVDMRNLRPLVWTKINGVKARFLLDSGSFYSSISPDAATQRHLKLSYLDGRELYVMGLGGAQQTEATTVDDFEFLGVHLHHIQFLVLGQGGDLTGIIGQNLLRISDMEYDLANGIVRFMKPAGCNDRPLAYWALHATYTSVKLQYSDPAEPQMRSDATINGRRMTVWFDTGTPRSMLFLEAAKRAGITPSSPGVRFLGISYGIGPASAKVWVAPVDTFQLGGEKVEHTHLLIGDFQPRNIDGSLSGSFPDMILGDDFFLSHRIYVAYSQNRLYFTYNGGPLFNLNLPGFASAAETAQPAAGAASAAGGQSMSDAPTDATGFRRRGMAYASTRQFDRALADLTRACDLAPGDAENRYQRGVIYLEDGQVKSALQDFDAVITARPDDIDARLARAELLHSHPETEPGTAGADAKSDLDAVSRLATPDASVRFTLSRLYHALGDYSAALSQIDEWLDTHRLENDQSAGLNSRCWLRATSNRDLPEALHDCNRALDLRPQAPTQTGSMVPMNLAPENPDILDSRGLVYLRLGKLGAAIADYGAALNVDPGLATSLYGRGLAEVRLGETAQGQQDLAAAEKIDSGIAKRFADMGLTP